MRIVVAPALEEPKQPATSGRARRASTKGQAKPRKSKAADENPGLPAPAPPPFVPIDPALVAPAINPPVLNGAPGPVPAAIAVPAVAVPANNSNYRDDEVENLLSKILAVKPYTDDGWDKVVKAFNNETTHAPRALKSLIEKYRKLRDMKKPTGNPTANKFHQRALECEAAIRELTSTFGVNDPHGSDEDVELEELEERVLGKRREAPNAAQSRNEVLDVSSDSETEVEVVVPAQGPSKRKGAPDLAQRPAQVLRREPAKIFAPRTTASQLHNSLERLVENTSPGVERTLNQQRHKDDMLRIHYFSMVEENRSLRAQLDSERERRSELMARIQRYELLEEMRRIQAQAPYHPMYQQHAPPYHNPLAAPAGVFAPVAPVAPVAAAAAPIAPAGPVAPLIPVEAAQVPADMPFDPLSLD